MSVGNSGIMSAVCGTLSNYTIDLEYLLKIPCFILDCPSESGLLIFGTFFWVGRQHCPMSEKKIYVTMNGICVW